MCTTHRLFCFFASAIFYAYHMSLQRFCLSINRSFNRLIQIEEMRSLAGSGRLVGEILIDGRKDGWMDES